MKNTRLRLDVIDTIRFIACFIVVMGHFKIPGFAFGWIGVDIFFVISGFVVTRSLEKRVTTENQGRIVAPRFILDRLIRLYPALLFAVILGVIFTILFSAAIEFKNLFETGFAAIGSRSNIVLHNIALDYFAIDAKSNFFTHTWSLGVEFQIYFVVAIVTLFFPKWVFLSGKILLIPSIILIVIWMLHDASWSYLTIDRAWEFAAGILSYKFSKHRDLNKTILFFFLFSLLIILFIATNKPISIFLVVIVTAIVLIFNANSKIPDSYQKIFSILAMQGRATYSIYLMHWPIAVILHETYGFENYIINVFAILFAWLLGLFSYLVFEKFPATFAKKEKFKINVLKYLKTLVTSLIFLIYLFGVFSSNVSGFGAYIARSLIIKVNPNFDYYVPMVFQGIPTIQPLGKLDPCHYRNSKENEVDFFNFCLQNTDKSKPNFYLIGDSHAMMLQYGLRPAVESLGRNFYWIHNDGINKIINHKVKEISELNYVSNQLSKNDILAFTFYRGKLNEDNKLNLSKNFSDMQKIKMQNFKNFFIQNVNPLIERDIKILLINDGPRLRLNLRAQVCQIREQLSGKDVCMLSNKNSKLDRLPMTSLFEDLAALSKNIFIIDYHDQLCNKKCSYKDDNNLIMTDHNHISKEASSSLEIFWINSLKKLLQY